MKSVLNITSLCFSRGFEEVGFYYNPIGEGGDKNE